MSITGNQALPGLVPIKNPAGTAPRLTPYTVDSGYGTAIGSGNLLVKTTTGVELAGATPDAGTVIGVAAHNVAASLTADTEIMVFDDVDQEFSIIADGAISDSVIIQGRFCGIASGTNVYNTTLRQGNTKLDISTAAQGFTTALLLQIRRVVDDMADDLTAANVPVIVKIADPMHVFGSQLGINSRP